MERRELRRDRHTVSLLTDHTFFSSKYRGKILVGDVVLALDGIIRKTCKDLDIEIINRAVNVGHVHLFVKYPLKYPVSFISKRIKGRSNRELRKAFPHPQEWCKYWSVGAVLIPWIGRAWIGGCGDVHTESGECEASPNAETRCTGIGPEFGDYLIDFSCHRSAWKPEEIFSKLRRGAYNMLGNQLFVMVKII